MSFLGVLNAPTSWGDRTPNALPGGMSGLRFGANLALPGGATTESGGPSFNSSYVIGKSDYYDGNTQHTNDRSVKHFSQNVSEWQEGDTLQDQLTWFQRPAPNPSIPHDRVSYKMFCWSAMNYRLQHNAAWRAEFGSHLTAEHLRRTFALMGCQQSKQTILKEKNSWNEENNMILTGRARMPNMWLAQSSEGNEFCVGEGASLYVIYRRHRYLGDAAADSAMWEEPPPTAGVKRKHADAGGSAYAKSALDRNLLVFKMTNPDLKARHGWEPPAEAKSRKQQAEYYWSIDPYVTYDRTPPHPALYRGDHLGDPDNYYTGDYEHVGMVTHVARGNNERTARNVNRARNALYPGEPGKSYYEDYFKLDCLEVMLRMGK